MSRLFDEVMWERQQKKEALLEVPEALESMSEAINELQMQSYIHEEKIIQLQKDYENSQRMISRLPGFIVAGIIGTLITLLVSLFI